MAKTRELTIRIGGDSAKGGIVTTGEVLARIAAYAGLYVYTVRTIPAEIKGGHVMFQLRAATHRVHSQGDTLDVLLAYDEESYQRYSYLLHPGGSLFYNSNEYTPPVNGTTHYGLPLDDLARQINFPRGHNIIAIGALVKVFGLPYETAKMVVERQLGRKAEILAQNLKALEIGYRYVEEQISRESPFHLEAAERRGEERLLVVSGNQALSMGAIAAGCTFFAGYPITPASDIMEFLAAQFPKLGGSVIQAEDEIAAVGMAIGASYAGRRAMTATSGPGIALMSELIGHAAMAEVPLVVVDVQRCGPSTGIPTKVAQGDLNMAIYGSNDESPRAVVAPISVEDCFYQMVNAFNLAEKWQIPVLVLSDQDMAVRVETVPVFHLEGLARYERLVFQPTGVRHGYQRYLYTESGVSPMSHPGQIGGQYTAEGLEHHQNGTPAYDPQTRSKMFHKRFRKQEELLHDARALKMLDRFGDDRPVIGIIGWGSTSGPVREAIELAKAEGIRVAALYPRLLYPVLVDEISAFAASVKVVIVAEMNYLGQLSNLIEPYMCGTPVERLNKYSGVPITTQAVHEKIQTVYAQYVAGKQRRRKS